MQEKLPKALQPRQSSCCSSRSSGYYDYTSLSSNSLRSLSRCSYEEVDKNKLKDLNTWKCKENFNPKPYRTVPIYISPSTSSLCNYDNYSYNTSNIKHHHNWNKPSEQNANLTFQPFRSEEDLHLLDKSSPPPKKSFQFPVRSETTFNKLQKIYDEPSNKTFNSLTSPFSFPQLKTFNSSNKLSQFPVAPEGPFYSEIPKNVETKKYTHNRNFHENFTFSESLESFEDFINEKNNNFFKISNHDISEKNFFRPILREDIIKSSINSSIDSSSIYPSIREALNKSQDQQDKVEAMFTNLSIKKQSPTSESHSYLLSFPFSEKKINVSPVKVDASTNTPLSFHFYSCFLHKNNSHDKNELINVGNMTPQKNMNESKNTYIGDNLVNNNKNNFDKKINFKEYDKRNEDEKVGNKWSDGGLMDNQGGTSFEQGTYMTYQANYEEISCNKKFYYNKESNFQKKIGHYSIKNESQYYNKNNYNLKKIKREAHSLAPTPTSSFGVFVDSFNRRASFGSPSTSMQEESGEELIICLIKEDVFGLGFSMEGGKGDLNRKDQPIKIKSVFGLNLKNSELLRNGDEILKINDKTMEGLNHFEAWREIRKLRVGSLVYLHIKRRL